MKRIYTLSFALLATIFAMAQTKKPSFTKRANDHFMIQLGSTMWSGQPDSIKVKNFGRTLNVYLMLDFPFKSNPRLSTALGLGVGSDGVFFNRTRVELTGSGDVLRFTNLDSQNHFKKYKLTTVYAEIPVELRYVQNPENSDRSFKFAVGAKVGAVIGNYTRGKTLEDKLGNAISNHTEKIKRRGFINSPRLVATARIGWGNFSVFGQYAVTPLLKDGAGAVIRPYSIGLTISGL